MPVVSSSVHAMQDMHMFSTLAQLVPASFGICQGYRGHFRAVWHHAVWGRHCIPLGVGVATAYPWDPQHQPCPFLSSSCIHIAPSFSGRIHTWHTLLQQKKCFFLVVDPSTHFYAYQLKLVHFGLLNSRCVARPQKSFSLSNF
jgi:hypothetical protein